MENPKTAILLRSFLGVSLQAAAVSEMGCLSAEYILYDFGTLRLRAYQRYTRLTAQADASAVQQGRSRQVTLLYIKVISMRFPIR